VWEIEAAKAADMPEIEDLIAAVGGDRVDLATDQFVVAKSEDAWILGCGRLRPYPDFYEIASMAVADEFRTTGIGRAIVERLLKMYEGAIYLICEDDVVEFFSRFGFSLLPESDMPDDLRPKWDYFCSPSAPMNLMRRG
jgi:N-acetylglutamate synthase-like GNAT family acetyltransferase